MLCLGFVLGAAFCAGRASAGDGPIYPAANVRLDKVDKGRGNFITCLISGTYDPDGWDKNLDPTLRDNAVISGLGERFKAIQYRSDAAGQNGDGQADVIELMQWSWAERARCQTSIGEASAVTTGVAGLAFIMAKDRQDNHPTAIKDDDLKHLAVAALIPIMLDDVRAIGPTRRYYTSAVLGTSLMMSRNSSLLALLTDFKNLPFDAHARKNCNVPDVGTFALHNADVAGIETLQAKLIVDINSYKEWCRTFSAVETQVELVQLQADTYSRDFQAGRYDAWRSYAKAVNTGGYEQKATTAGVLHKILALPFTAASNILSAKPEDFKLGDNRAQLTAADAATLPVLEGNYDLARPAADIQMIGVSIAGDVQALRGAVAGYHPVRPAAAAAKPDRGRAKKIKAPAADDRTIGDYNILAALDPAAAGYIDQAAALNGAYQQAVTLAEAIKARNAQHYLILDVNSGGAYLAAQSVSSIIKDTAKADTKTDATTRAPAG